MCSYVLITGKQSRLLFSDHAFFLHNSIIRSLRVDASHGQHGVLKGHARVQNETKNMGVYSKNINIINSWTLPCLDDAYPFKFIFKRISLGSLNKRWLVANKSCTCCQKRANNWFTVVVLGTAERWTTTVSTLARALRVALLKPHLWTKPPFWHN